MTRHGSDAGKCSKEFSKASGSKKNTSYLLYRFTTEEEPEEDQRTARRHASKFCVAHSAHIKGLVRHHALPRRGGAAVTAGCPGAAGWLAWLPPLCGLLTDKLSPSGRCPGTVQRFFRGQTGDWRVSRYGCSNLLATDQLGERRGCACNSACELS